MYKIIYNEGNNTKTEMLPIEDGDSIISAALKFVGTTCSQFSVIEESGTEVANSSNLTLSDYT